MSCSYIEAIIPALSREKNVSVACQEMIISIPSNGLPIPIAKIDDIITSAGSHGVIARAQQDGVVAITHDQIEPLNVNDRATTWQGLAERGIGKVEGQVCGGLGQIQVEGVGARASIEPELDGSASLDNGDKFIVSFITFQTPKSLLLYGRPLQTIIATTTTKNR
jgi:hypothetical protein